MKAPEKIYLQEPTKVRIEKKYDNDVEYIHTDAFIEKACDWFEDHIYEYLRMNKTWNEPDYEPKLINDFRRAMKGE